MPYCPHSAFASQLDAHPVPHSAGEYPQRPLLPQQAPFGHGVVGLHVPMGRARGTREKFGLGERASMGDALATALRSATSRKFLKDKTTMLMDRASTAKECLWMTRFYFQRARSKGMISKLAISTYPASMQAEREASPLYPADKTLALISASRSMGLLLGNFRAYLKLSAVKSCDEKGSNSLTPTLTLCVEKSMVSKRGSLFQGLY